MKNIEVILLDVEITNTIQKEGSLFSGVFPWEVHEVTALNIEAIQKEAKRIRTLINKVIPEKENLTFQKIFAHAEAKKVVEASSRINWIRFDDKPDLKGCKMLGLERKLITLAMPINKPVNDDRKAERTMEKCD